MNEELEKKGVELDSRLEGLENEAYNQLKTFMKPSAKRELVMVWLGILLGSAFAKGVEYEREQTQYDE